MVQAWQAEYLLRQSRCHKRWVYSLCCRNIGLQLILCLHRTLVTVIGELTGSGADRFIFDCSVRG
ncbi:unnamed protein product [Ixodes persulcatus]